MNKWSALRPYLFFVVLALAVGGAAGAAARAGMDAYDLLTKPPATPPDWLFPVVWTLLYLLMGIAMGRVWRAASGSARRQAAALWCVQLGVNAFWPVVFFLWQERRGIFPARRADRARAGDERAVFPPRSGGCVAVRAVPPVAAVRGVSEPWRLAAQPVKSG